MEIKQLDQILINNSIKKDSIDIPDCFGEFNKKNKLCSNYCSISIRCCVLYNKNPKIDILEKLLIHNHYAIKLQ
ncbi:hypothetical protein [Desulfobacula sp.]|uniref:hypothetical protein n=1 Tax=Desulfobacula sp. TaxID=2593537 RepID=UPI0025C2B538|nr:hypothetical protein [Desulfobacula sp.]MBC2704307.1 hypothetical protein [Desulfobacula sp.]